MKEFEKWWGELNCILECNGGCDLCQNIRKQTWRAALEWAMTLANAGGEIAYSELEEEVICT